MGRLESREVLGKDLLVGVCLHGPDLHEPEGLTSAPHSHLPEEDGSRRIQPDGDAGEQDDGEGEDQHGEGDRDVYGAFGHVESRLCALLRQLFPADKDCTRNQGGQGDYLAGHEPEGHPRHCAQRGCEQNCGRCGGYAADPGDAETHRLATSDEYLTDE